VPLETLTEAKRALWSGYRAMPHGCRLGRIGDGAARDSRYLDDLSHEFGVGGMAIPDVVLQADADVAALLDRGLGESRFDDVAVPPDPSIADRCPRALPGTAGGFGPSRAARIPLLNTSVKMLAAGTG
jgi:hypothetical protein